MNVPEQKRKVNLAQEIGKKWKCTYSWRGKQSDCFFFIRVEGKAPFHSDGCKYQKKANINDPCPECTCVEAHHTGVWKSDRGGRPNYSHPRKLKKNHPNQPLN